MKFKVGDIIKCIECKFISGITDKYCLVTDTRNKEVRIRCLEPIIRHNNTVWHCEIEFKKLSNKDRQHYIVLKLKGVLK